MAVERPQPPSGTGAPSPRRAPIIQPQTVWSATGSQASRRSTYLGPTTPSFTGMRGGGGPGLQPQAAPRQAQEMPTISRDALKDAGKTKIEMSPYTPETVLPEDLKPPERKPGFFEFMLGGLVEAFTGVVPDPIRGGLVRGGQLVGEALDIPGELLGHVPVNQLFGLENTEQAFELMPLTNDKRRVMQAITADPTEAQWYMSQYLRTHAGDYAEAKGLPQVLANLILPDATIQERFFMGLGVPSQVLSTFMSQNVFHRWKEILDDPNLKDPALVELRDRYRRGEFGAVGSQAAIDRFGDEIVRAGFGWSNDPFIGMVAEMVTDPLILTSMGTGLAYGAVRTGALARRAQNIASLAKSAKYMADSRVASAVQRVDAMMSDPDFLRRAPRGTDTTYAWAKRFQDEVGDAARPIVEEANDMLRTPERGARGVKDYYAAKYAPLLERAASVSYMLNEPFSLFGKDGAGRVIGRVFSRDVSNGVFAAYGWSTVGKTFDVLGGANQRLLDALGHAISYSERSMAQGNMSRFLRMNLTDADGRTIQNAALPDTLTDPDTALDRILGYKEDAKGNRVRDVTDDELNALAQQAEVFTRRKAEMYEPDLQGIDEAHRAASYDKQMQRFREDAAKKLQRAGFTSQQALDLTRRASSKELAWFDYIHWGSFLRDFIDVQKRAESKARAEVDRLSREAQVNPSDINDALLKEARSTLDMASRLTVISEDLLTMQRARALVDDIEAAADLDTKVRIARSAVDKYELLYQNFFEKTRITSDEDFVARTLTLLREGLDNERYTVSIDAKTLADELPDIAVFRGQLHAARAPYEFGLAPAADRRWAPIYNEKHELVGYNTWMDVRVTPADVKAPTNLVRLREALMTPIRGENIMQESRRKFTSVMNRKYGLSKTSSSLVWDKVREMARAQRITMRGFTPTEFRYILDNVDIQPWEREQLGYRGLADAVARAMEGDLSMVGATTKLTGWAKTRTSRFQNYLGTLAEKIYPLVRFNLNPLFQLQELIEPYFFNVLRGVKVGWNFSEDQIRVHNLLDELNMADRLADGFEAREFMMAGSVHARNIAGPNTDLSKVDFGGIVATKKRMNYYNLVKRQFGDALHDAFEREMPGRWMDLEIEFNRQAGRNLSRGDIAEMWLRHKGAKYPDNPWQTVHHLDGAAPDEYGRIRGITVSYIAKQFGLSDADALRDAIADPTNTRFTEDMVKNELIADGFTPQYADRAWEVLTGPSVDEVMDAFRGAYEDAGLGFHQPLAEALLNRMAISKGISLDEYIARKFTHKPEWVDRNARLPLRALTQLVDRLADEYQMPPVREGPFFTGMMERAKAMLPEEQHATQKSHINAAKKVVAGKLERSSKRVARNIEVEGFPLFKDGPSLQDFIDVTSSVLDPETTRAVSKWYPEVAPVIAGVAKNMDDQTLRAFVQAMNESGLHLGDDIMVGPVVDDAVREEVGARMLMAWGATQVQTSPRDGFQYTMAVLDSVRNANRVGAKGVGAFADQKKQFAAMFSDLTGALTKEKDKPPVPVLASGRLNISGLGAKLHDFIDSLLGNNERRSFMRGQDQMFARADGSLVPMAPGAMDIWMGRDFGFVDSPLLGYLKDRLMAKRGLSEEEAMTQVQLQTGFFYKGKVTKVVKGKKKQVDESMDAYRERKAKWEKEHKKELKAHGLKELQEVWSGSPTAAEYETMLAHYNRLTDELNSMDGGDGWLGRGYNNDPWTVADVQAVAWMRIQKQLDIDPGGPNNMFYQNSAQVSFEVLPGENTPLANAVPMHRASDDAKDLITSHVMHTLTPILQEATGVQIRRVVPGRGGWRGGPSEYTLSPSTYWEMLGSPEAIDDALDALMFLTQQDMVFATQTVFRTGGDVPMKSGKDNFWSIDFSPSDDHPLTMERLSGWLEENKAVEWNGHMVAGRVEGNLAVRTVYSPSWDAAPQGYKVVPDGTDLAGFEREVPMSDDVARKLADGSWATEAGMEAPVPVTVERQLVRTRSRTANFRDDADRADARRMNGDDAATAYREELGRSILDDLRARGRGDLADALVGRHMASVIEAYDAALQRYDGNAWSVGRGHLGLREAYAAERGGPAHLQRKNRVWLGATKWSRDVDAAQRIIAGRGVLSGRRGGIIFRETRANATTVPHELFHLWADDLDPSGVKSVHDAFFASPSGRRYLANGGSKPRGRNRNNHLIVEAEEWAAAEFERYMATGVAPNGTMNAAFNDYANWYSTHRMFVDPDPALDAVFSKMTPEMHKGPRATYDVDEYRLMEVARQALLRAEEEAFRVHYYKRGRTWLERSINHPYLGLYPASYMWGKVLPEMLRFLTNKPFGVNAPFAGLQMANHVFEAIQLQMNTDNGEFADFIEEFPELLRFIQLLVPGTPWDIPVNAPAWTRRIAEDAWRGRDPDFGRAISDTVSYAFGPGRAPQDVLDALGEAAGATQRIGQRVLGQEVVEGEGEEQVLPQGPRLNPQGVLSTPEPVQ